MEQKLAYKIKDLDGEPFGISHLYSEIRAGRLIARKSCRATVVLHSDWESYLASLPKIAPAKAEASETEAA